MHNQSYDIDNSKNAKTKDSWSSPWMNATSIIYLFNVMDCACCARGAGGFGYFSQYSKLEIYFVFF